MKNLFLILLTLFLISSCSEQEESVLDSNTPPHLIEISVSFSGFNIATSPMSRADEGNTLPENLNRCALSVFDESGAEITSYSQKKGEEGFGSASFNLMPGTYTFVCVINEAQATTSEALADIEPATITSPTAATLPGSVVHDTYCFSQPVTITAATTKVPLNMGSRINSRFQLTLTDVPPTAVSKVQVVIAPESSAPTGSISFNPKTKLATTQQYYSATRSITNHTAVTSDIVFDLLPTSNPFQTKVRLYAFNNAATPSTLYYRELPAVEFVPNRITHATGSLFTPQEQGISITINTPWDTNNEIPF